MKEDKSIFLKVDSIEPVFKGGGICSREQYLDGIKVWIDGNGHFFPCYDYTVCNPNAATEDGRRQAFSLFKELYDMPPSERFKVFGTMTMIDLVSKKTYDDLAKMLDDWKKEKEAIHVRDEVENKNNNGIKFVVTVPPYQASNSLYYFSGIGKDGKVYRNEPVDRYKKTGVHICNLDEYLEV